MTECPFCGKPGQEVIRGVPPYTQYRCDPCETTWSPVPVAAAERPAGLKWVDPIGQDYKFVPFIDHGERSVPCP